MALEKKQTLEYLKQFKQGKEQYQKDLSEWTDAELAEHYKELESYYGRSIRTDNLLGRFDDPNNVYYWHTIEENNPVKLERRLAIGYSIVQNEEDVGLKRSQDASRMGNSSVIKDVKGGDRAVLLKIPKELYELNQRIKQQKSNNQALFDPEGRPLKQTVKQNDKQMVVHTESVDPFEVDTKHLKNK